MCLYAVYYILSSLKRRIITDMLIDTAFQEGVYARLKPLIEHIAQAHVGASMVLDKLANIDLKLSELMREQYSKDKDVEEIIQQPIAVATSIKFIIKAIFLIVVTMAAFMFLLNFNLGGITPYGVLLIFIMWWVFITSEYNLWREDSAWGMVFLPILVVPVGVMLLANLINYNVLMAMLYVSVGVYTLIYYLWAVYATTGSLPVIVTKKEEAVESEFFALQQKSMLKELINALISRISRMENKKQEVEYAWKR